MSDSMYIANLGFLLNYTDGSKDDEIQSEIFKVAFQDEEEVHYDRQIGGNFRDIEQEPSSIAAAMKFTTNLIKSIYYVNQEKNSDPYIVIGYSDITINDESYKKSNKYFVDVKYKLLKNLNKQGAVSLG